MSGPRLRARGPRAHGARPRPAGLHLAGIPGRARADRWPLAVAVLVVALSTFLAVATPRSMAGAADTVLRSTVRAAGPVADTSLTVPFPAGPTTAGLPEPDSAAATVELARQFDALLPPTLAPVLGRPRASVVTQALRVPTPPDPDGGAITVQPAWLWNGGTPPVHWTAGAAPGAAPAGNAQVPVGLAEPVAALLQVGVGGTVATVVGGRDVTLVVTGLFRPDRPADPIWRSAPGLLSPLVSGTGPDRLNQTGALLSDASLPAARLAVDPDAVTRTVVFPPDAAGLHAADAVPVARAVTALEAQPSQLAVGTVPRVSSGLGTEVLAARERLAAASAQAPVLLTGLMSAAGLVLLLTAALLAVRRRPVLALARARGASLPGTAAELTAESAAVAGAGGGLGVLAALPVPGPTSWAWLLTAPLLALVTVPVLGVVTAARATGGRRQPADREHRRVAARDRALRRGAAEAVLVLLATGALVALRVRGGTAGTGQDLLLAAGPALALATGGAVLLRVLPPVLGRVRSRARRTRSAVPLLAAVRSAVSAGRALPVLALTVATGLSSFALTLAATVDRGQLDASWAAVGGDVAATAPAPDPGLARTAVRVADAPGVARAVGLRVEPQVPLLGVPGLDRTTVLVVDPATFAGLLRSTPLPDLPGLDRVAGARGSLRSGLPALVTRGPGGPRSANPTALVVDDARIPLLPVGDVPPLLSATGSTVVLDAGTLARAAADPSTEAGPAAAGLAAPNTVLVVGPGARAAVAAAPGLTGATVTDRRDQLAEQRTDPLTRDLTRLMTATAVAVLVFAVAGVLIAAAASAPERARALATLRTLGLSGRQVRRVIAGELVPPVLVSAVLGAVLGVLVAAAVAGPLQLQRLTGAPQPPSLVLAWPAAAVVLPLLAGAAGVVLAETARRRRDRLGEVLRIS